MNPWMFLAGAVAATTLLVGTFAAGVKTGRSYEKNVTIAADLTRAERVIVKQEILVREVPKIVERVVVREKEIEKEVERVVARIPDLLAPDCVLPDRYGMLLVAAANGVDPSTGAGDVDAFSGEYGCREVLAATLSDLQAGWRNSARLQGLQEWENLVTKTEAPPD